MLMDSESLKIAVRVFCSNFASQPLSTVQEDTCLRSDLCIDGIDADAFFAELCQAFEVELSSTSLSVYFYPEGLMGLLVKMNPWNAAKPDLTVGEVAMLIHKELSSTKSEDTTQ